MTDSVPDLHEEGVFDDVAADTPIPILRTFAQRATVKVLSGLAELSFVAGREGDDEWEWREEAGEALVDAFRFERVTRVNWFDTALGALHRAFEAGVAQRKIDLAAPSPSVRVVEVARAHAVIYADEIDFADEACPSAIDAAISHVAYKIAERHSVTPAEAAHVAMLAFKAEDLRPSLKVASQALQRAEAGYAERVAEQTDATRRAETARQVAAEIFGQSE